MHEHNRISDYALIGNGQTAALVSKHGSIDWCCWPRFDGPAVFNRLLDARRGGFFQLRATGVYQVTREYVPESNVLQTTHHTPHGSLRIVDFMPGPPNDVDKQLLPHRVYRRVTCIQGRAEFELCFKPAFNFARAACRFEFHERGVVAIGNSEALTLTTPLALRAGGDSSLAAVGTLAAGEEAWFVVTHGPPEGAREALECRPSDAHGEYERTLHYWRRWASRCSYEGPYRAQVLRSALALKLLVYQPTGALIAAPTTSLPAELGGTRNWDYRFAWLRDAGLTLDALQQLGYHDESMRFIDWVEDITERYDGDLRVLYDVDGNPPPREEVLGHLSGYRDSRPVRIGNGASEQVQLDNYGHVLEAVVLCHERMGREVKPSVWKFLSKLTHRAASRWRAPGQGPWEIRGEPRHHLYSKLYCWVGFDRAIRLAERTGLAGDLDLWKQEREHVRQAILDQGYNKDVGAFVQTLNGNELDASALTIPLVGFLPMNDSRVLNTLKCVQERLTVNGLVYRYDGDDGLPGRDASFTLCSFWLIMNLAQCGRLSEAKAAFEHVCGFANDVHLLAEQINPITGDLLGNFPQGFAHLGLIRAALHLQEHGEKAS